MPLCMHTTMQKRQILNKNVPRQWQLSIKNRSIGFHPTGLIKLKDQRHYYKNVDLSRLENRCCPGFPTGNTSPVQKGVPFCPGSGNRDKRCSQRPRGWRTLLSRLVLPTGTKGLFFHIFFLNSFSISIIYFCISIKLMYCNSVCMISTNIYIYIYIYIQLLI